MYYEFKTWYEYLLGNNKYPSKAEFKKYLAKKYPKLLNGNNLHCFRFKIKQDEQYKNGEAIVSLVPGY
jgi:hypothetical protein